MENLIKKFFNRETKQQDWEENVYIPIKKTVQPDKRLTFNETFKHINKQLNNEQTR